MKAIRWKSPDHGGVVWRQNREFHRLEVKPLGAKSSGLLII
jgi:hypothetical protein